jgi:hypothetical protein
MGPPRRHYGKSTSRCATLTRKSVRRMCASVNRRVVLHEVWGSEGGSPVSTRMFVCVNFGSDSVWWM